MKTIAIAMHKGGVGKTTIAHNLAWGLARRSFRVLVIDTDPQGTLSRNLAPESVKGEGVAKYILPEGDRLPAPIPVAQNLHLLPATSKLLQVESSKDTELYWRLKESLQTLSNSYDFCLIDIRPSLGPLTVCVLVASNQLLIPVECDKLSTEELPPLMNAIDVIRRRYGRPDLEILGLVMNRVDVRTSIAHEVREALQEGFNEKVFENWIPQNARIRESVSPTNNIFTYDIDHKGRPGTGAQIFESFVNEFLRRCGHGRIESQEPETEATAKSA